VYAAWVALLLGGCGAGSSKPAPPAVDSGTPTVSPTATPTTGPHGTADSGSTTPRLEASCLATDNALRMACEVVTVPPVDAAWVLTGPDGARAPVLLEAAERHGLFARFLVASTTYSWRVEAGGLWAEGSFETGALPDSVDVGITVVGTPEPSHLLFANLCSAEGHLGVLDTTVPAIVWYQDVLEDPSDAIDTVVPTEEGTMLVLLSGQPNDRVLELDFDGEEVSRLTAGAELPLVDLHHDVFRRGDTTAVLFRESLPMEGGDILLDGFAVHKPGEEPVTWHLSEHYFPERLPASLDVSHANSIWLSEGGTALVTLRHLSAVLEVVAEPSSALFGEVLWSMVGDEASDLDPTLPLTSTAGLDATFYRSHHAVVQADGRLTLFDNRSVLDPISRVLFMDVGKTVVDVTDAIVLPQHCDFQGSVYPTGPGRWVATCAPHGVAYGLDESAVERVSWQVDVDCSTPSLGTFVPRFIPITVPL
jgi:hypothetical protein